MAKQKKPIHRVQMTEGKRNIIHQLMEEYDIQTAEDIQEALKDLLGGTIDVYKRQAQWNPSCDISPANPTRHYNRKKNLRTFS